MCGCTCGTPDDAEPEDHDLDCPEHPTGEEGFEDLCRELPEED